MEPKKEPSREARLRKRDLSVLEFLRWVCFIVGVLGFITWLGDVIYWSTKGYTIHPLFESMIGPIPSIIAVSSGILLLGCGVSALEKNLELNLTITDPRLNSIEKDVSEMHTSLFETTKKMEAALSEAQSSNEELRAQVYVLTKERDKLSARLKTAEENLERALAPNLRDVKGIGPKAAEKLRRLGLEKVPDLLNVAPDELSSKMKVSRKVVGKWFEEAIRMTKRSSAT